MQQSARRRANRFLALAITALATAPSCKEKVSGSCQGDHKCAEVVDAESEEEGLCTQGKVIAEPGTWTEDGKCSRENLLGSCQDGTITYFYYHGYPGDISFQESFCKSGGGTWSEP